MESSKFLEGVSKASGFISKYSTEILTGKYMRGLATTTAMLYSERVLSERRRKSLMDSVLTLDGDFEKFKRKLTPNNQLRREGKPMRRTINYRRLNKASRKNKRATEQFDSYFVRTTHPIINKEDI